MRKYFAILTAVIFFFSLFVLPTSSFSHPGRTNKRGGHYNRKTGSYHIHSGSSSIRSKSKGGYKRKQTNRQSRSYSRSAGCLSDNYTSESDNYSNNYENQSSYEQLRNYSGRPRYGGDGYEGRSYGGDGYDGPSYYGKPNMDQQQTVSSSNMTDRYWNRRALSSFTGSNRHLYHSHGIHHRSSSYFNGNFGTRPARAGETTTGYENGAYHTPSRTLQVISDSSSSDNGVFVDDPTVIDGDTVKLTMRDRQVKIRLYGLDAPESNQPGGQSGMDFLRHLITGKTLYVIPYGKDKYGRTLAVLYADGVNVNEQMLANGYAWYSNSFCNKSFCSDWQALSHRAIGKRRGLWVDQNSESPWNWRARQR